MSLGYVHAMGEQGLCRCLGWGDTRSGMRVFLAGGWGYPGTDEGLCNVEWCENAETKLPKLLLLLSSPVSVSILNLPPVGITTDVLWSIQHIGPAVPALTGNFSTTPPPTSYIRVTLRDWQIRFCASRDFFFFPV